MSHEATNWAVKRRGLRPIDKVVLWHLADCHNPSAGCFPTQEYLALHSEVSRSSVNRILGRLEAGGLIRREQQIDPETKRQRPTRYRLAFEEGFEPLDVVACVPGSDTEIEGEPCPKNDDSRVPNSAEAVSHSSGTLTSKGTGKTNQEKNARTRLDPTEGLEIVGGKVRIHSDDPLFRKIVELRGNKHPPTDRQGFWTFPPEIVAKARKELVH